MNQMTKFVQLVIFVSVAGCAGSPEPVDMGLPEEPILPIVPNQGGPIIAAPKLVTITWASDSMLASDIETFDAWILQSSFWKLLSEYGVGTGSVIATWHVPTDLPAMVTETDVATFLVNAIGAGSVPQPTPDTLYSMFLPLGVATTGSNGTSCIDNGGYHDATMLSDGKKVYYSVVPRCPSGGGPLDALTHAASHEYVEAATDPDDPFAYRLEPPVTLQPFINGELGDLCEDLATTVDGYNINPFYSNLAAKAGQRPCVPGPSGPVFAALADPDLLSIPIGKSGQTTVRIATVGGDPGPLSLYVYPMDLMKGLSVGAFPEMVHAGDKVPVTVTVMDGMTGMGQIVILELQDGSGYLDKRMLVVFPE
jgi:hypothetical protein